MDLSKRLKDGLSIALIIILSPILIPLFISLLYLRPVIKKICSLFKPLAFFVWWLIQGLSVGSFVLIILNKEKDIEQLAFVLVLIFLASLVYAVIKFTKYIKFSKRWSAKKKELPSILLNKLRSGDSLAELYSSTVYSDEFRNPYQYDYPHIVVDALIDELIRLDGLKLHINTGEEWQNESFDQEWYDKVDNELKNIRAIHEEIKDSKNQH